MTYKYLMFKDFKRRQKVVKYEKKRLWLKSIMNNHFLNYNVRLIARKRLTKFSKNDSLVRIKNRLCYNRKPQKCLSSI
jgi:hypothetical protein